jgi:glycosyltransferase involved in cell wall biosynthesis
MGIQVQNLSRIQPLVSAIIPTLNSERFLEECLSSLQAQNYRRLEVIIVDDGSRDSTVEIAQRHNCQILRNPRRGRAEAKNTGIQRAHGEYLLFVDSDMELTKNVVQECVNLAEKNRHVGGVVIPERSVGNSPWVRARDFERGFYAGTIVESARFFPTDIVKAVGGFEENLVFFEESTLPHKIQRKGHIVTARIESPILHHEEDFSLSFWLRKKFEYGKTAKAYRQAYHHYSEMQMGIWFRFGLFMKNRQQFWSRPQLAISTIVLKGLEYSATALGQVS